MNWPELYFARHGETNWNRERRYQGSRDIPLNELGRRQAAANGELLRDLLRHDNRKPEDFDWIASPLSRASETMDLMRQAFDGQVLPDVRYDDRLKEISFGTLEGRLHTELPPELALAPGKRDEAYWLHRPEDGENYEDVSKRLTALSETLKRPTIMVAHGGILRVMRHLLENAPRDLVLNWHPPQGTVAHFHNGTMNMHHSILSSELT